MQQPKIAAVITAAGYGSFREDEDGNDVSKMVETVEDGADRPMVVEVVKRVFEAGLERVVVVINQKFHEAIEACLSKHKLTNIHFVVQPWRHGAADAVHRAIQHFDDNGMDVTDVLVVFGDMPLWTSTTISTLVQRHVFNEATVSLATVHLNGEHPHELERYGRIVRKRSPVQGKQGPICDIVEPGAQVSGHVLKIREVNPSLYVVKAAFFKNACPGFRPTTIKQDGYPQEINMPDIVSAAHQAGELVWDMPVADPEEALGVNKFEELREVREIIAKRK